MTGQYAHTIDAKGRLFIPAKLREELGGIFHVMLGQDGCLSVYSDDNWNTILDRLKTMSFSKVKTLRTMSRQDRITVCRYTPTTAGTP